MITLADRRDALVAQITNITCGMLGVLGEACGSSQITALASAVAHAMIEREDALRAHKPDHAREYLADHRFVFDVTH